MDFVGIVLLLLAFALLGFLVFLITTYIPMPDIFKQVLMVAVAVMAILYLLAVLTGSATFPRLSGLR